MLDITIFKSLSKCTVKKSVIHIPGPPIPSEVLQEFKVVLRRLVLTGRIPHYRPIKVLIEGIDTKTVIECPRGLSNSYMDMIPILKDAIVADEHNGFQAYMAGCDWPKGSISRQFDASLELERRQAWKRGNRMTHEGLFTSKSIEYGDIYVSDLKVTSAQYAREEGADKYLSVHLEALAADKEPINKVAVGSSAKIAIMWSYIMSDVSYEMIDRSTREMNGGISIEQSSSMANLFIPMLSESDGNTIFLLYKREINEEVLQSILRSCGEFYLELLQSENEEDLILAEESLYG